MPTQASQRSASYVLKTPSELTGSMRPVRSAPIAPEARSENLGSACTNWFDGAPLDPVDPHAARTIEISQVVVLENVVADVQNLIDFLKGTRGTSDHMVAASAFGTSANEDDNEDQNNNENKNESIQL